MADIVVTVPMSFWADWIEEGDAAGEPYTGEEWGFYVGFRKPAIDPGERLYIVAHGQLRGYAPVVRVGFDRGSGWAICRRGDAVACTIETPIKGFRGWRYRWWEREDEKPFPGWMIDGIPLAQLEALLPRATSLWLVGDGWSAVEAAAVAGHPYALAMLVIATFCEAARQLGVRVNGADVIKPIIERVGCDEKTAERYLAYAIEPLRKWGMLGPGAQHGAPA